MTHKKRGIGVARCPQCTLIHLVLTHGNATVESVPLTREEWARLIGAYGDMLAGKDHINGERMH